MVHTGHIVVFFSIFLCCFLVLFAICCFMCGCIRSRQRMRWKQVHQDSSPPSTFCNESSSSPEEYLIVPDPPVNVGVVTQPTHIQSLNGFPLDAVSMDRDLPIDEKPNQHLGRIYFSVQFISRSRELMVEVIKADELVPLSSYGLLPLAYVELFLLPDIANCLKTRIHPRSLSPQWNEIFLFEGFSRQHIRETSLYMTVRYRSNQLDGQKTDRTVGAVLEPIQNLADRKIRDGSVVYCRFLQPGGTYNNIFRR